MCGIVGSISFGSGSASVERVRTACQVLSHRGPDDAGLACGSWRGSIDPIEDGSTSGAFAGGRAPLVLGHRRLSIIELGHAGHQPMISDDRKAALVFNGEIYNYVELRAQLSRDVHLRTHSDTEVLLAGLRLRGADFLKEVTGMFAFAYVDLVRAEALLGRDHFGIKPLYYSMESGILHFASELAALRAVARADWRLNPRAALQFLRFGVTDDTEETFFDDVRSVPPAHAIVFGADGSPPVATRYWRLSRNKVQVSAGAARESVAAELSASVALHLRSDVPVGACLSGGLDSTALVAHMRGQLGPSVPIHAFSFISPDDSQSEAPYVRAAVDAFGLTGHVTHGGVNLSGAVADVVRCQGEPFASLSIVAQYAVFQSAHAAGVKVLLDGQGADELFGGYVPAVAARIAMLLREGRWREVGRILSTFEFVARSNARARMIASAIVRLLPMSVARTALGLLGEPIVPDWVNRDWFESRLPDVESLWHRGHADLQDELVAFVEQRTLPALLRFEDRNSMRWSVESRVPFCTPRLAELAMSLAPELLVDSHGRTKSILRDAVGGLLPDVIVTRPKIGFLAPERLWMGDLSAWSAEVLRDGAQRLPDIISWNHEAMRLGQPEPRGFSRWRVLSFAAWAREWNVQGGVARA